MSGENQKINFKNIAIIGSNGFIGRNLAQRLAEIPGANLFLFGKSEEGSAEVKAPYKQINLSDEAQINRDFADIDIVYYLASESIPSSSWETPVFDIEKNLVPFLKFLEYVVKLKAKKVVFLSSAGTIYGPTKEKADEHSYKLPFSPHGITKLAMEYFLNYFNKRFGLNFDIYRVSNVYGEGQNTQKGIGIINTFLEGILTHGKVNIFGDGSNVRNYLYVKDLAELLTSSLYANPNDSDIFNASSNDTLSINELVEVIKKVVPEHFQVNYTPTRQSDNSTIYLDNSHLLQTHTNIRFTPIEEGIAKTYRHIRGGRMYNAI